jgi:nitrogen fixation NifU-like protein
MGLSINNEGTLQEIYFDGDGCCISQAAASMLVEKFDQKTIGEVKQFSAQDMLHLFGVKLTPNRQKCCLLPWRVLQAAVHSPVAEAAGDGGQEEQRDCCD